MEFPHEPGRSFSCPEAAALGSVVQRSHFGSGCKVYRGGSVIDSAVGSFSTVGDDACVIRSSIGSRVAVNRRNYVHDSVLGDLTYTGMNTIIHSSEVGRCCSIACNVEIGAKGHNMSCASLMPHETFAFAASEKRDSTAGANLSPACFIGGDVWIGAGAIVLSGVHIGPGAVIGAGAVVIGDIPPFSVAVGVPAKAIRLRFPAKVIHRLLKIAWWEWDAEHIARHEPILKADVDEGVLERLERIQADARL